MKPFSQYAQKVEDLAHSAISRHMDDAEISAALNGGPSSALRNLVPLDEIREAGAFFTAPNLAQKTLSSFPAKFPTNALFFDPACGVGDLLIASAQYLPISHNLAETLDIWGKRLAGYDIYPEFIRVAKARLVLSAIQRGALPNGARIKSLNSLFPHIRVGNGLKSGTALKSASHIVLNPPFNMIDAPSDCEWAHGKVSLAALFLNAIARNGTEGTTILAILPEVLRTGTRYEKWRQDIVKYVSVDDVKVFGQFDSQTDIDVFTAVFKVNSKADRKYIQWWMAPGQPAQGTVGDIFDISIGPVVPYRDLKRGPWYQYIHPRSMPAWGTVTSIAEHRRYLGTVFTPPFVVVRRTSRPGDENRAIGTIIKGSRPVAIENHLIVLIPKDGTVKSCERLLKELRHPDTSRWLDQRIRCRHLTISSLHDLPWWSVDQ